MRLETSNRPTSERGNVSTGSQDFPSTAPHSKRISHTYLPWLIAISGLLAMYAPSVWDLSRGLWTTDTQGHGPIVLAVSLWLIWRKVPEILQQPAEPAQLIGWPVFICSLLFYFFGRSQEILLLEMGALILSISGCALLLGGTESLKKLSFALFFLIFLVPLPGAFVDVVTQPMKTAVSYMAESILASQGFPISRSGVVLQIAQYQLLVADACAGLHTLFTLEALGLLYMNLVRCQSLTRNLLLGILIVPISFTANVIRVIALTLVTYYLGDDAGQGFLHKFAGMFLFLAALALIISIDSLIRYAISKLGNSDQRVLAA